MPSCFAGSVNLMFSLFTRCLSSLLVQMLDFGSPFSINIWYWGEVLENAFHTTAMNGLPYASLPLENDPSHVTLLFLI